MTIVHRYIDVDYPVFQSDDKALDVLARLDELDLGEAPVLKDGKLFALVSSGELRRALAPAGGEASGLLVGDMRFEIPESVRPDVHLLDVFPCLCRERSKNLLAISGDDGAFVGVAPKMPLLRAIASLFHFDEKGATIEIEVPALGVKLSEIIGVLEKNEATVLSFGVAVPDPGAQSMVITFRLRTSDSFRLAKTLEKYGYAVHFATPSSDGGVDELREKALEFMRYIDM
ncbi:hypothetical protein CHL67_06160 [Prosthecochloris sp. GSB1]|uniref:hypothetical protein n=1 Tax=Prosthecochloris sp. GSB1 TaxID=281093 RepID=UPI000B8CFFA8|nr:hypothetical protein [Prosthecochloris sp. GSB1]ASQ90559.1 hypothetical protein CHL67_06160 [Prosthecochloris sp. GSB1]